MYFFHYWTYHECFPYQLYRNSQATGCKNDCHQRYQVFLTASIPNPDSAIDTLDPISNVWKSLITTEPGAGACKRYKKGILRMPTA